jgi:hypothetical protein
MDLHEREGTGRWIGAARDAAEFLLSWVWQYDVAFPPDSLLGSRGFSTRGMTSVSIAHHHLDFYGMAIAYDFLRYARATGDVFFEDQAVAMLRSCRQLVAGEADPLGRPSSDRLAAGAAEPTDWIFRPAGVSERLFRHRYRLGVRAGARCVRTDRRTLPGGAGAVGEADMTHPFRFSILTLNLWNTERWDVREPAVAGFLNSYDPDICCFQEVRSSTWRTWTAFMPEHSRVSDPLAGGPRRDHLYRRSLFSELEHGAVDWRCRKE